MTLKLLWRYAVSLLLAVLSVSAAAQSPSPSSGEYSAPPSKDVSFLLGDWLIEGEHPNLGPVKYWSIHFSSNGKYYTEVKKDDSSEMFIERGVWSAPDRDFLLLIRQSVDFRPADSFSKADVDIYSISAIYRAEIDLRRTSDSKPTKLMRQPL